VLFSAFEPSGDAHAAPVIAALRRARPELRIYAVGGPKMEAAGAEIVERTCDDGAMGLAALSKAMAVRGTVRRMRRWVQQYRVLVHIPVDSPAANFPLAKVLRRSGARVVHLVAPQLWAWGGWRIGKLRRITSLVLCLLPFEERWFTERDVPARFIGHPVINRKLDDAELDARARSLPGGSPKILILPGSRSHEVKRNIRMLVNTFIELQGRRSGLGGLICASSERVVELVRRRVPVFPNGLHMVVGNIDGAIRWCDMAMAVSGTVTLDLTRQRKPMIGVYRTGLISWLGAKVILRTPYRLLPNVIARREIVPEFVPHWALPGGDANVLIEAMGKMIGDSRIRAQQAEELGRINAHYAKRRPDHEAAEAILDILDGGTGMRRHAAAPPTPAPNDPVSSA